MNKRGFIYTLILILILIIGGINFLYSYKSKVLTINMLPPIVSTPYQFPYKNPIIPKSQSYRIIIVGDSIVNSLGLNANVLREDLIKYYPDNEFVTYNYGYPSTNVLSLYQRLTQTTNDGAKDNQAILTQQFELIVIESFGNNPLSQFALTDGLQKQNEELERSVNVILTQKSNAALAFLTPIALDPINYARGSQELSAEVRKQWVVERIAYIDNHRKFSQEKGIPVIDVYNASLKLDGTVDKSYISDDFIHPSNKGIELISQTIADYIFNHKIFPNSTGETSK